MALIRCKASAGNIAVEAGHYIESGYKTGSGAFIRTTAYTSGTLFNIYATNYAENLIIPKCSHIDATLSGGTWVVATVKNGVPTLVGTPSSTVNTDIGDCDYVLLTAYSSSDITGTVTITD